MALTGISLMTGETERSALSWVIGLLRVGAFHLWSWVLFLLSFFFFSFSLDPQPWSSTHVVGQAASSLLLTAAGCPAYAPTETYLSIPLGQGREA